MSSVIPNGSYPIREFARITGVNPATLRAWERRYGIIRPLRTEKGHRFFNEDHVARVRQILYWLEQGYPIRQVRLLLDDKSNSKPSSNDQFSDDYLELAETATQGNTPALPEPDNNWGEIQQSLEIAISDLNTRKLNQLLSDLFANYPLPLCYLHCLKPIQQKVRGLPKMELGLALFEQALKHRLIALMQQQQRHSEGEALLLLSNQADAEIELLIRACSLGAVGLRVELLPPINAEQFEQAIFRMQVQQCWIQLYPMEKSRAQQWLSTLHSTEIHCHISGTIPSDWPEDWAQATGMSSPEANKLHHHTESMPQQIQQFVRALNQLSTSSNTGIAGVHKS